LGATSSNTNNNKVTTSSLTLYNNSSYKFDRGYPTASTAELAYNNTDLGRAIEAYKFFFPTLIGEAFMQAVSPVARPNEGGVKFAAGPNIEILTPNSDTPYAAAILDLKSRGPMVIEMPPGNFIGLIDDHNYRWIIDVGNNGPDKGHGGKYLTLPPGYNDTVPSGYNVGKSQTWKATVAIRSVPADGNKSKALEAFDNIKIYPLSDASKPSTFQFVDVTNQTVHNKLLDWEGHTISTSVLRLLRERNTNGYKLFRARAGLLTFGSTPQKNRPLMVHGSSIT
jgi:hypothetical protein